MQAAESATSDSDTNEDASISESLSGAQNGSSENELDNDDNFEEAEKSHFHVTWPLLIVACVVCSVAGFATASWKQSIEADKHRLPEIDVQRKSSDTSAESVNRATPKAEEPIIESATDPNPSISSVENEGTKSDSSVSTSDTQQSSPAADSIDSSNGALTVSTDADAKELILKAMQVFDPADASKFEEWRMRLDLLPKPLPGDHVEASKFNKAGLAALKAKEYSQATESFRAASRSDPSDSIFRSNLGYAEMHNDDLNSAIDDLHASIALASSRQVAWDDLGEVYARKNDREKAIACFLIGYNLSKGDTAGYLKSLLLDENEIVRDCAMLALKKLGVDYQKQQP